MKPNDPLHKLRAQAQKALSGFTSDFPVGTDPYQISSFKPDPAEFPVPELVLLLLGSIMGFKTWGVGEKVRWSVLCSFNGVPVVMELQKFGFAIRHGDDPSFDSMRLIKQLQAAIRQLERALQPLLNEQIETGNVTLANRVDEFDSRYRFFRQLAEKSFARAARRKPAKKKVNLSGVTEASSNLVSGVISEMLDGFSHSLNHSREGFFFSVAMIDAYFSLLEHKLVLLRAFTGQSLARGEFSALLSAKWDAKIGRLINLQDRVSQLLLGRLRSVKERIRNPFAHGGVENDNGSIFCHVPGCGAIPGNLTRSRTSVRFKLVPVDRDEHSMTVQLFDEVDLMLSQGALAIPSKLVEAGIDAAFDSKHLKTFLALQKASAKRVDLFIERWHHEMDRHTNMDY